MDTRKRGFMFMMCGGIIGAIVGLLIISAMPSDTSPKELQTVTSDQVLTEEQTYKFSCKNIMNSDILDAKDPDEYKEELIAFVGNVVSVEESEGNYIYRISDIGLSDGGGIWKAIFPDKFNIGDIIIIYGSNAVRENDIVSIDPKYMEIYRE